MMNCIYDFNLPEISLPRPIYNPLPLQCLAASALPESVQREIDEVIALYSAAELEAEAAQGPSDFTDGLPALNLPSPDPASDVMPEILLKRDLQVGTVNDVGIRARITGGVKCVVEGCGELHAVVTSVRDGAHPELKEGVCIKEWCGKPLDGKTYEEVVGILNKTDTPDVSIVIGNCKLSQLPLPQRQQSGSEILMLPTNPRDSQIRTQGDKSQEEASEYSVETEDQDQLGLGDEELSSIYTTIAQDTSEDFHNGSIELSLKYNSSEETLYIILLEVKNSLSRAFETGNLFVNSYLIPDTRKQGVGTARMNLPLEQSPRYSIAQDELESVALRLILWEITNGKTCSFRGETLLDLSDASTVNITGKPTWYTTSKQDPNLPALQQPFNCNRPKKLNKKKQTALQLEAVSYLSGRGVKSDMDVYVGGKSLFKTGNSAQKQKALSPGRRGSGIPVESKPATEAVNKQQLSSILQVLRDEASLEGKTLSNSPLNRNESLRCLESRKFSKLATILQVLRDTDSPVVSEAQPTGYELTDGAEEDDNYSTLDKRRRRLSEKYLLRTKDTLPTPEEPVINNLRRSLNAGRNRKRVSIYQFSDSNDSIENMSDSERKRAFTTSDTASHKMHYKLIDEEARHREKTREITGANTTCLSSQASALKETRNSATSDCSCYSAEVSVEDVFVDREEQETGSDFMHTKQQQAMQSALWQQHKISRSLGDIEDVGMDERPQALECNDSGKQTPEEDSDDAESSLDFSPHQVSSGVYYYKALSPDASRLKCFQTREQAFDKTASLDSRARKKSIHKPRSGSVAKNYFHTIGRRVSKLVKASEPASPDTMPRSFKGTTKMWNSFDDLLNPSETRTKAKSEAHTAISPSFRKRVSSTPNASVVGSVQLRFQSSAAASPAAGGPVPTPTLHLSVTDISFVSSSYFLSEMLLKVHLYHTSTGVRLMKGRASITPTVDLDSKKPLADFKFETDIRNLSVQVVLITAGHTIFSKKSYFQVSIDLNSLSLEDENTVHTQWYKLEEAALQ